MALLIVSIVMATGLLWFSEAEINILRTRRMITTEQIYLYAELASDWAVSTLAQKNIPSTAMPLQKFPFGSVVAHISPLGTPFSEKYAMAGGNDWYLLETGVRHQDQILKLHTLFLRKSAAGQTEVIAVRQSR